MEAFPQPNPINKSEVYSCIRKILDQDTASLLVHALITSRLDNGNSLFYGITDKQINKLQRVQNAAARMLLHML